MRKRCLIHLIIRGGFFVFLWVSPLFLFSKEPFLLSSEGSGRATAYLESPKIISFEGKTHVAWLDSPTEGFRIRIRTLDQKTGVWSKTYTVGVAQDNHGGPALTIDGEGYLHIVYYSHHHPFRYSRSLRPNDASEWSEFEEFGEDLTYPALVCGKDGTLLLTARRSFENKPWELEMWSKSTGETWSRQSTLLKSRFDGYAQFAASLTWSEDHTTLHLGTRIYERPIKEDEWPLTTVGYMKSLDRGKTWIQSDGTPIDLPATAETIDSIASGRGVEGRILNAGSIAVGPDGLAYVPYSVRVEDSSQGYLAYPYGDGKWRHLNLNAFLPSTVRDWALFMHGGVSFGSAGEFVVAAVVMQVDPDGVDWGEPSSELVIFRSIDGGLSFQGKVVGSPDSKVPRWMPNLERATGFNEMPLSPRYLYTNGGRGTTLNDVLSNEVWWVPSGGE